MNTSNKTLLQILTEELPKCGGWPKFDREMQVVQDDDGEVKFHFIGHTLEFERNNTGTWGSNTPEAWLEDFAPQSNFFADRSSDYATAIITREQYEAALAAKNDGWIDWGGGECPVDRDALVEVKYRNGTVKPAEPARFYIWTNGYGSCSTTDADIIAYRLHQPQDANSRANDERLDAAVGLYDTSNKGEIEESNLNECIGQQQSNDQARDEILYELANFAASTCTSLDIGAATQIAIWLSDKGYRKQ